MHKLVGRCCNRKCPTETVTEATLRDIYFIRFDLTAPTAPEHTVFSLDESFKL